MIHASTTKPRTMLKWEEHIKSKEDYERILKSGIAYVVFGDEFPDSWEQCQELFQHKQNLKLEGENEL